MSASGGKNPKSLSDSDSDDAEKNKDSKKAPKVADAKKAAAAAHLKAAKKKVSPSAEAAAAPAVVNINPEGVSHATLVRRRLGGAAAAAGDTRGMRHNPPPASLEQPKVVRTHQFSLFANKPIDHTSRSRSLERSSQNKLKQSRRSKS